MHIKLKPQGSNQNVVSIGGVDIYFSYAAAIAFETDGERWFNPEYRGYSVTTSKHANQMGVKYFPDAASGADFERRLSEALAVEKDAQ